MKKHGLFFLSLHSLSSLATLSVIDLIILLLPLSLRSSFCISSIPFYLSSLIISHLNRHILLSSFPPLITPQLIEFCPLQQAPRSLLHGNDPQLHLEWRQTDSGGKGRELRVIIMERLWFVPLQFDPRVTFKIPGSAWLLPTQEVCCDFSRQLRVKGLAHHHHF